MLLETEEGIWARADARVFRLLMDGGRTERRIQAAERTVAAAFRPVEALRKRCRAGAAREQVMADRRLDRELSRAWEYPLRIRTGLADRSQSGSTAPSRKMAMLTGVSKRTIRTYQVPMVDERGIDAQRQAHVGAAAMAAHERGEHVHAIARNAVIVESNELAVENLQVDREVQARGRLTTLLEQQMHVAGLRAHAHAITARTKVIATSAHEMIERVRRAKAVVRSVASQSVLKVRDHAHAILRRIQRRRVVHRPSPAVRNMAMPLAVTARTITPRIGTVPTPIIQSRVALTQHRRIAMITADRTTSAAMHRNLAEQRAAVAAIHERLVAHDRQNAHEQARRLILTAKPAPYRLEHNRLILDLSAMPAAARQTIESLPHDDLGHALRERHRLDQQRAADQRKAADAAAKRVEAARTADIARRTLGPHVHRA